MTSATPPAYWYIAALEAERLVLSDDNSGAVLVRRKTEALLARMGEQALSQTCPDYRLFDLFEAALRLWVTRIQPHERDRVRGIVLVAIASVRALVREADRLADARAQLSHLERALPAHDR